MNTLLRAFTMVIGLLIGMAAVSAAPGPVNNGALSGSFDEQYALGSDEFWTEMAQGD